MTPHPSVQFDPPDDPLFRGVELRHVIELPVLGLPVRFESNSRQVIDAVVGSFGIWQAVARRADLLSSDSARVRLIVHEGEEGTDGHARVRYRWPDPHRLMLSTKGSLGVAELDALEACVFVTPDLVADTTHFQYSVVEALTLVLVTGRDRHPIHAATIARDDAAVLLVGASGSGKSTLSYAALESGLTVLGEDIAYVQMHPEFRLWTMPGRFHLPLDVHDHFPELRDRAPSLQANGKEKIAVDYWHSDDTLPIASRAEACLLSRDHGPARLERIDRSTVNDALSANLESGFDRYPDGVSAAAAALAGRGGWRLHVSQNPHESVPLIHEMLDEFFTSPAE